MATSRQLREQIAAGRWDAALAALYGGSEEVLARQRSRYGAALEQFELYYGPGRQVQVYSAPGRTELGGNHTDHQHGYGLAGAVTLDLVAVASRNEDGFIRVKSRGFNKLDVIDLTEEEPQQGEGTHSASLIRGIAEGFRAKGCDVGGFDAYTASDVLRGSGLSSSAAFEMGVAIILNTEYGCGMDAPALARICQFAENTYFGKPSGLLDQLTSAVGGVLFADFADPTAPKIEKIHADGVLPEGMTLCVTDTRASHSELTIVSVALGVGYGMEPESLMSYMSFVFQDVTLFNDTVMNNIRLGNPNATDDQVIAAAKAAYCDEFIREMPDGYQTVLGENGSTLSGGERQRISIARALLKNAPIILLDEATASLDPENEVLVQKAIAKLVEGKTVIMIAHRLRTVVDADQILVLDNGRLVEHGTHDELMKKNGLYHKLFHIQQESLGWAV